MLHGFSGTAHEEDSYLSLRFRVSRRGFILLEPEGTVMPAGTKGDGGKELGGNQFWNATDACCDFAKTGVDDVSYIMGLVAKMKALYNIDTSRIYIYSHSNGGFMANRLACENGDQFAAIAALAGGTYKDAKDCRHPTPMPYLQIQAVNDTTILYQNSPLYSGGKETVAQYVQRNGCNPAPTQGPQRDFIFSIPGKDTTEQAWTNCSSGKDVAFWTIKAHTGKYYSPHVPILNLDFTESVLDFFFDHQVSKTGTPSAI